MNRHRIVPGMLVVGLAALCAAQWLSAADAPSAVQPAAPAASTFAPADDLLGQVDFYIKRTDETLANKAEFDDAAQTRLKKDANTLVALGLTLGLHDTENRLKPSAGALVKASQALSKAANYEAAQAAFAEVKKAAGGAADGASAQLKWERAAALGQLMKQVPSINLDLKRGVTPARFKTLKAQSLGKSAALAAIAQTVMADTHEVKNPADLGKWYQYCTEFRDAAAAVNAAVRAEDQAATTAAMARLAASCETCHATFRKEEL